MRLLPWATSLHVKLVLALAVLVALVAAGGAWLAFDRQRALEVGMNDHVAKPVRPDELFATLARWVRKGDVLSVDAHP